MANDLEINIDEVFNFAFDEYIRNDLIIALNEMTMKCKKLSQTFEKIKQKTSSDR